MDIGTVQGGRKLRDVASRLREAGDTGLRRELTTSLKEVPAPIVRDLQEAVRHVKVTGFEVPGKTTRWRGPSKEKGLRERIAQIIGSKLTTAGNYPKLTLQAVSAKLPESMRNLPKYLDNSMPGPWRHPLPNTRDTWAQQEGQPWWWKTIQPHLKDVRNKCGEAIDRVAEQITRGL